MKIDRNNYEIYFLDYLEGRLTADETAGLLIFVKENPDLKALIESEERISLVPDKTINFYPKSALKRKSDAVYESGIEDNPLLDIETLISTPGINSQNYEEFMIRFYENDLNDSEKADVADFLKDSPLYIKEFELFESTILKPNTGIIYPHKSRLKRNIIARFGVKRVITIIALAASVLLFSTLFLKYIYQPIPGDIDKQIAQTFNRSSETKKTHTTNDNTANIKTIEIIRSNNSEQLINSTKQETKTSGKNTVERKGIKPLTKRLKTKTTERITLEVPTSLNIRQTTLLATTRMNAPQFIERRTDFDGITSTAYYDPDPDALPLKADGQTIGGRLGYTLAKGISQTVGTIAREPEVGRLLSGKFSLSAIAGLGLAGFNLITDSKLSLSRDYDSDGYLKGHSLNDGDKRLTRLP